MKLTRLVVALLAVVGCSSHAQTPRAQATAQADLPALLKEAVANPKRTEDLYKTGQKVSMFCANCHGDNGNSSKPEIPNLAGQNPAYLLEQLRKFTDGSRRNEFMEGMIKALSADEKVGMVLFYSRQTVAPRTTGASAAVLARGKDLYSKSCWRCHAEDGHGNATFARIAGQQPAYLAVTLKRYRTNEGARTDPIMAANTKLLSDADIEALIAHVSTMR